MLDNNDDDDDIGVGVGLAFAALIVAYAPHWTAAVALSLSFPRRRVAAVVRWRVASMAVS